MKIRIIGVIAKRNSQNTTQISFNVKKILISINIKENDGEKKQTFCDNINKKEKKKSKNKPNRRHWYITCANKQINILFLI